MSCYFALAAGIIAHNHNHCATFENVRSNRWFGNWISLFYGYPTFVWVPTHNLNHHKLVNTKGDATITWRYTNSHNAFIAASYFFVSAYFQSVPINAYIATAKEKNRGLFRRIVTQYVVWIGGYAALLALAIGLHGFATGLYLATMTVAIPAVFSLWTIMLLNYEQHVHADPWSSHDHSRNFVSPVLNYLLFNNGFHTVHHEAPGQHWSGLAAAHSTIRDEIDPDLNQKSLIWYWVKQYALSPFWPNLGTVQIGAGPLNEPAEIAAEGGMLPLHRNRRKALA